MTRVDFYLLSQNQAAAGDHFACRLTEKAFRLGHRVFLHTQSDEHARSLDELLWSFRDRSFVPHGRAAEADRDPETAVVIGHEGAPEGEYDLLINCGDVIPDFFSRFPRVAEPVINEEAAKARSRERYRFYRDRGYPLEMHKL